MKIRGTELTHGPKLGVSNKACKSREQLREASRALNEQLAVVEARRATK